MRAVIQRVSQASVSVEQKLLSSINNGLLILLGVEQGDSSNDVDWLSSKIINLRIFNDESGLMNKDILAIHGDVMIISQFTLFGSTKKGNRPSFIRSAKPDEAIPLYNQFIKQIEVKLQKTVSTGKFGADMQISLINDGPVTIIIDTKNKE